MATKQTKVTTAAKAVKIRDVDQSLWRRVRIAAISKGMTLRDYVIETLSRSLTE